jgi:acyl carrier protein
MNINSRAACLLEEMASLRKDVYAVVAKRAKVDEAIIMADTKLCDLGLDPFCVAETLDDIERRFDVALSVAAYEMLRTSSMDYLVRTIWAERLRPGVEAEAFRVM